jgi:MFS family permease
MMVSAAFWGKLSDRFGRKVALVISGLFLFFYAFLSTFAPSYPWILCLRPVRWVKIIKGNFPHLNGLGHAIEFK